MNTNSTETIDSQVLIESIKTLEEAIEELRNEIKQEINKLHSLVDSENFKEAKSTSDIIFVYSERAHSAATIKQILTDSKENPDQNSKLLITQKLTLEKDNENITNEHFEDIVNHLESS